MQGVTGNLRADRPVRDLRVQTGRNVISESLAGHPDDARSQLRDQRVGLGLGPQSMRGMRGQSLAGALRGGAAGGGRDQAQQVAPERFGGRDDAGVAGGPVEPAA